MNIKELALSCGSFKIRDEIQIRFWEDTWVRIDRQDKQSHHKLRKGHI
jgi:hypothetical protein